MAKQAPDGLSQILGAVRGGVLPHLVAIVVEHEARIGWRRVAGLDLSIIVNRKRHPSSGDCRWHASR
jgi:hypothetical protein